MEEWLSRTLDLINKVSLDVVKRGEASYSEIDVLLSNIQANALVTNLSVEMKNEISLFVNLLEKLGALVKEIHLVLTSVDYDDCFTSGDYIYFYNYRLDTYLRWEDLLKLNESYRMAINLIKQFARKAVYLILAGQEKEEEKPVLIQPIIPQQQVQPQQAQPAQQQPTQQTQQEGVG
jgi:hypothetical protein